MFSKVPPHEHSGAWLKCPQLVVRWDQQFHFQNNSAVRIYNKVITTMVNGAARRTHIMCSICVHSIGASAKAVRSLHHFTTSQCVLKCALLTLSSTSNWLAKIWQGDFSTLRFGVRGDVGGRGPFDSTPLTHMVYLLPFFSYLARSKSVFVHPRYDGKYHSRS